ncbi:MAG: hypothetical protein JWO30_3927 [Fibrobacteres bacterium]|nr:hypothetical protein [Fibrobacterota bacterium]
MGLHGLLHKGAEGGLALEQREEEILFDPDMDLPPLRPAHPGLLAVLSLGTPDPRRKGAQRFGMILPKQLEYVHRAPPQMK